MDGTRFDRLARNLGERRSRRGALGALLGGLAGGVAIASGAGAAPKKTKPDCCPPARPTLCGYTCTATATDPANCGACGTVCASGVCNNGACQAVTPTPTPTATSTPSATCTDGIKNGSETDIDCGGPNCPPCALGKSCVADADCQSGVCAGGVCTVCQPGATRSCYDGPAGTAGIGICQFGTAACLTDGSGYGPCQGQVLPQPETCNGLDDDCDGQVDNGFDLMNDPNNCGACGHVCFAPNATPACRNGVCTVAACNVGWADCDGNPANGCEINTSADPNNCGGCGIVCPSGATCQSGQCVTPAAGCQSDADCGATSYCAGGTCAPKQSPGRACTANNQCISGNCLAGTCQ